MSAQSRDVWNSFAGRQQTSDFGSGSGTGFPRSFYQSAVATGTSDCPRSSDENSSASSHSYDFRNQCHSSKPAVLGDRNNVGHYAANACPLDLNCFQSQPFLGQRSEFVVPLRASPSRSSSVEVPRVKKPLNAFMIFMREMRKQVADECAFRESAVINQFLGRKWNSMDRSEQMKYYDMARREKELHGQLHPLWSARDNYSKKRKRKETPRGYESEEAVADGFLGAKKCRARFGMDKQLWCKSCRLKKRCVRFLPDTNSNSKENHLAHSMSSCLNVSNGFGFCASKTLNCDGSEARRVLKDVQPMESRVLPFRGGHGTYSSTSDQGRPDSGGYPRQGFCAGGFSSANYGARVYSVMTNQSQLHGQSDDYLARDCWSVCDPVYDAASDLGEKSFSLADRSTGFVFPSDATPFNPYVDTRPLTSAWNVGTSQGQPYGGFEPFVPNEDAGFPGLEGRSGSSVDRQTFPDRSFGSYPGVWAVCSSSPGLVSCCTGSAQPYWRVSSSCYPTCRQGLYHTPTDFAVDMYSAALPVSRLCSLGPQVMGSCERHPHQSSCVSGYEVSSSFDSVGDQGLGPCPGSMHTSDQSQASSPTLSEDGFVVFLGGCLAIYLLALLASSVAFVMFACILFLVL